MIEIPHGWTNVIYHSRSQQYFDTILLTGLIAVGMGRKEGKHTFSAPHLQKSKVVLGHKNWKPQIVLYVRCMKLIWSKYKKMDLTLIFGDVPAECVARVSLDTIKRSCTKDQHKLFRTHGH